MKIKLNKSEIVKALEFQKARKQYAIDHNLTHTGNAKDVPQNVDQLSILAEVAFGKVFDISPIMELGQYHTPDCYVANIPIDVKASFRKPKFAVRPDSIKQLPKNTLVAYCVADHFTVPPDEIEIEILGLISHQKVKRDCYFDSFGHIKRTMAYAVYTRQLTPFHKFLEIVKSVKDPAPF